LALQQPRVLYDLLFAAAWEAVQELAADPRYLGAVVGPLAVLHTWGQTLCHHPHLHCVVTGGGLSCDPRGRVDELPRWLACRRGFFLPVRVLGRLFRGKFLAGLRRAHAEGRLPLRGKLAPLAEPAAFAAWLAPLYGQEWVVYAKPPFGGPAVVLKYLARYVHLVASSNSRLLALRDGAVTFRYHAYAEGRRPKTMTLAAGEFLRRLLQHVVPAGFVRVRHYGLLANRHREARLRTCRRLLLAVAVVAAAAAGAAEGVRACPGCGGTAWVVVARAPRPTVAEVCRLPLGPDSS
jgi:hypothetical protein